jgi:hypothetical protein
MSTDTTTTMVPFDLYKDIHKGIRQELCTLVVDLGRVDPGDRASRVAVAARVFDLVDFLVLHAHHEDTQIDGAVDSVLPAEAESIRVEHLELEQAMDDLKEAALLVMDEATPDQRSAVHALYLGLAAFTGRHLLHQDVEERVVMPALFAGLGLDALLEIHGRILAAIDPDQMAWSLAKMVPAMNADDRFEMFAGMRAGAPPEAFAGLLSLAGDVLPGPDHRQLVDRLDAAHEPVGTGGDAA